MFPYNGYIMNGFNRLIFYSFYNLNKQKTFLNFMQMRNLFLNGYLDVLIYIKKNPIDQYLCL